MGRGGDEADQRRILLEVQARILKYEFVEGFQSAQDGGFGAGGSVDAAAGAAAFVDEVVEG